MNVCSKKPNINHIYIEDSFSPDFKNSGILKAKKYDKKEYKTTVLINMVRQLLKKKNVEDEKLLLSNLSILFKHNIDINLTDSDGRDAITYAIMNNSVETIRYLIKNSKKINF